MRLRFALCELAVVMGWFLTTEDFGEHGELTEEHVLAIDGADRNRQRGHLR